jgi:hypothetical protein
MTARPPGVGLACRPGEAILWYKNITKLTINVIAGTVAGEGIGCRVRGKSIVCATVAHRADFVIDGGRAPRLRPCFQACPSAKSSSAYDSTTSFNDPGKYLYQFSPVGLPGQIVAGLVVSEKK